MEVLISRDQKALYSRANRKEITNVVGVDIPFKPPLNPDLVVNNGAPVRSPAVLADEIVGMTNETFGRRDG